MELIAKRTTGLVAFKSWDLQEKHTGKSYGTLLQWKSGRYTVKIRNVVHPDLSPSAAADFDDRDVALSWAREQIESFPEPTLEDCEMALAQVAEWRYQDEMSDDFAYSNGKVSRWKRIESEVRRTMESIG